MITIELSEEEAKMFKEFREYQTDFTTMKKKNVFNFRSGKAVIHRDDTGKLRQIEIQEIKYKK